MWKDWKVELVKNEAEKNPHTPRIKTIKKKEKEKEREKEKRKKEEKKKKFKKAGKQEPTCRFVICGTN